jgi:hypothetical protein
VADRFMWREDDLEPQVCDACGVECVGDDPLCSRCAEVIDRQTEELLERLHFYDLGWWGE